MAPSLCPSSPTHNPRSRSTASKHPRRHAKILPAIATALVVGLTASGCSALSDDDNGKKDVLATFTVLADIARNVAGEHVNVNSLTKPGTEIHGYDPTPSDLKSAAKADLIISNGLGLEHWLDKLTSNSDAKRVVATDGIEPLPITDGQASGEDNPHAWMSPTNVKKYATTIAKALGDIDPDHKDDYNDNAKKYSAKLDTIGNDLRADLETVPKDKRALVTCEGAFSYLAKDAELTEHYIWPVNAETEATPQRMKETEEFVREHQVPAVFCESTVDSGAREQIVRATGAKDGGILYVDSLSDQDGPVPTYLDLIRYDADAISKGLTS